MKNAKIPFHHGKTAIYHGKMGYFVLRINHVSAFSGWAAVADWLPVETGPLLVLHHACGTNCHRNFVPAKVSLLSRRT
jgi:hypothetical protein